VPISWGGVRFGPLEPDPTLLCLTLALYLPQGEGFGRRKFQRVNYKAFIKSQLASRNDFQGLMRCKFGHVTPQTLGGDGTGRIESFDSPEQLYGTTCKVLRIFY